MLDVFLTGLADREFFLVYQPKVRLSDGYTIGLEALIRWKHEGEVALPSAFIPDVEANGDIIAIGRWVIEETCRQLQTWQLGGMRATPVAVNVSPLQFQDEGLIDVIDEMLSRYGVPAQMLEVEITESSVMQNRKKALVVLAQLSAMGVRVALDDFGSGYSSLGVLHSLAFDVLKVDQSFIAPPRGERALRVVNAVTQLAKGLHMETVAEGVSEPEQLSFVKEVGCDYGQGYLFSAPLAAIDVTKFIKVEQLRT